MTGAVACLYVPSFSIQVLLRTKPELANVPMAVVSGPGPEAKVLEVNRTARASKVLCGMTERQARSLCPALLGMEVPDDAQRELERVLVETIKGYSPHVELLKSLDERSQVRGLYLIDASGVNALYGDVYGWAHALHTAVANLSLVSALVVGSHRFFVRSIAGWRRSGIFVFDNLKTERREAERVPLSLLLTQPKILDRLHRLGVSRLGELLALPRDAVRSRVSLEAAELYDRALPSFALPVQSQEKNEPIFEDVEFESPADNVTALLFELKSRLPRWLSELRSRGQAFKKMRLTLWPRQHLVQNVVTRSAAGSNPAVQNAVALDTKAERKPSHVCDVESAQATFDEALILELLRLRLGQAIWTAPVAQMQLVVHGASPEFGQAALRTQSGHGQRLSLDELHSGRRIRDVKAAERGIARVRASYGEQSVVVAKVSDQHLPEESYEAEVAGPRLPSVRSVIGRLESGSGQADSDGGVFLDGSGRRRCIRRVLRTPKPISAVEIRQWQRVSGPYSLSGGWWNKPYAREYFYYKDTRGQIYWVYFDRQRSEWFLHGVQD